MSKVGLKVESQSLSNSTKVVDANLIRAVSF